MVVKIRGRARGEPSRNFLVFYIRHADINPAGGSHAASDQNSHDHNILAPALWLGLLALPDGQDGIDATISDTADDSPHDELKTVRCFL